MTRRKISTVYEDFFVDVKEIFDDVDDFA